MEVERLDGESLEEDDELGLSVFALLRCLGNGFLILVCICFMGLVV